MWCSLHSASVLAATEAVQKTASKASAIVIVGNSVGGSIPEVLFQTTKVDIVVYGEAEVTMTEVLDSLSHNKSFGEIVEHPNCNNINKISCEIIMTLFIYSIHSTLAQTSLSL